MARSFTPQRYNPSPPGGAPPMGNAPGLNRRALIFGGVALAGASSVAVAAAMIAGRGVDLGPSPAIDRATRCETSGAAPATTTIFVDTSEPFSNIQIARAVRLGDEAIRSLPRAVGCCCPA